MKLKSIEEDFIVEEINDSLEISPKKDNFRIYSLEKKGIETFALIESLSRRNKIPSREFGIAGLKDKHALTRQFFTLPVKHELPDIKEKNLSIRFLGYVSKRLNIGDLEKNHFTITARDIKKGELDGINKKSEDVKETGVPNYFDSQRFGSVGLDKTNGEYLFIERFVMIEDFESACKIFLTNYQKTENKRIKDCKRLILENWEIIRDKKNLRDKRIENILRKTTEVTFRRMIEARTWFDAFLLIPANLREMYVSAYQSYLWNECVKALLRKNIDKKNLVSIEYNIGTLTYYKNITHESIKNLPKLFPLISDRTKEDSDGIIKTILDKEKISISDFNVREKTGNFFKEYMRDVIIRPEDFSCRIDRDELNDNERHERYKAVISFSLQKGSYATCVTKKIFNE